MPWSPTQAFPHPLANIQSSNADPNLTNFVSYALVEMMTWQGLGDLINQFRERTLRLEPVSIMWAPGMLSRLRIPYTYCWSPALIQKPKDWGSHINISGFYFLSLASSYKPDPELVAFLEAGPPPVYIGFGSIVVDDPNALTTLIFDAVKKAGVRALVSKGWGGLGTDELGIPEGVYMLGNVPHDWLFKHVSAVVHHGGAGTTAAGVALGKPTVIVPFFGDQPWWGSMIARAGAGPQPIPYKQLTADNLAAAITEALQPSTLTKAAAMGEVISKEVGAETGAASFHSQLELDDLRCSLASSRVAVWRVKRTQVRLSALAAAVLGREGLLDVHDLKPYRPVEYESEIGPWDPISGGASALMGTLGSLMFGVADFPVEVIKALTAKRPENGADRISRTSTASSTMRTASSPTAHVQSSDTVPQTPSDNSADMSMGVQSSSADTVKPATPASRSSGEPDASVTSNTVTQTEPNTDSEPPPPERPHVPREDTIAQVLIKHLSHNHTVNRALTGNQGFLEHPDCPACKAAQNAAVQAGHSIGRIVEAGLRSPVDFTLAIARGFHNAPRLYGDKTVRTPDKVTGFQSGLKTAGKEFGQGLYDGITGLVTQPVQGAKEEGALGFVKGIGRGIGGLMLKPQAAIWALPGYTFAGVFKEIQKHFGSSTDSYIMAARTAQGYDQLEQSTAEERKDIIERWKLIQDDIRKAQQTFAEETRQTMAEYKIKRQQTFEEHKQRCKAGREHRHAKKQEKHAHADTHHKHSHRLFPSLHHPHASRDTSQKGTVSDDLEEAVKISVAATSQGDPEQDEMIERAIRASLAELQKAQQAEVDDQEALDRAVQASVAEMRRIEAVPRAESTSPTETETGTGITTPEEDQLLKEALQLSLQAHDFPASPLDDGDEDHPILGDDMHQPDADADVGVDDEAAVQKAIEESKRTHSLHEEATAQANRDDEAVLEQVKQMSLTAQQGQQGQQ